MQSFTPDRANVKKVDGKLTTKSFSVLGHDRSAVCIEVCMIASISIISHAAVCLRWHKEIWSECSTSDWAAETFRHISCIFHASPRISVHTNTINPKMIEHLEHICSTDSISTGSASTGSELPSSPCLSLSLSKLPTCINDSTVQNINCLSCQVPMLLGRRVQVGPALARAEKFVCLMENQGISWFYIRRSRLECSPTWPKRDQASRTKLETETGRKDWKMTDEFGR